jgi:hypothetical protein
LFVRRRFAFDGNENVDTFKKLNENRKTFHNSLKHERIKIRASITLNEVNKGTRRTGKGKAIGGLFIP